MVVLAGHVRRCPTDGSEHFPRTDPAVIVLVTDDDDRCLLGRQDGWPTGWFSTLAGFVEPGESPEQAVVREVAEETGIVVTACSYAGSQPWPFPSSLMLGYYARAAGAEPRPDGVELSEAHWYSRDDLDAALRSGEIRLSPSVSISRRLIEGWYGAKLDSQPR
jgi:NAD+ diphosphatase